MEETKGDVCKFPRSALLPQTTQTSPVESNAPITTIYIPFIVQIKLPLFKLCKIIYTIFLIVVLFGTINCYIRYKYNG